MHYKRKRPKDARAGCLMCKPWKGNFLKDSEEAKRRQELRADLDEAEQVSDAEVERLFEDHCRRYGNAFRRLADR